MSRNPIPKEERYSIVRMRKAGLTWKQIEKKSNRSITSIRTIIKEDYPLAYNMRSVQSNLKTERIIGLRRYRKYSWPLIDKTLGIKKSERYTNHPCITCVKIDPTEVISVNNNNKKGLKLTEREAVDVIEKRHPYLKYISGYNGYNSKVTVIDKRCGHVYTEVYDSLRNVHGVRCRICRGEKAAEREEARKVKKSAAVLYLNHKYRIQKEKERLLKKEAREILKRVRAVEHNRANLERLVKQAEVKIQLTAIECPGCGKRFGKKKPAQKYCSETCRKKVEKKAEYVRYRSKMQMKRMDDISLERLIERDGNVCYLCGFECDKSDGELINGRFIAHNNYPSIDHVIPIASGGTHTWDNVRLAHRRCNSIKQAKPLEDVIDNIREN